jgi:adenosylcobinamide-phosphate synthase
LINGQPIQTTIAFGLDLLLGDPSYPTHPVVMMGSLISWCEGLLRHDEDSPSRQRIGGILLVLGVVGIAYGVGYGMTAIAANIHEVFGFMLSVWLISTTIATKGLWQEARQIEELLNAHNLAEARQRVGRIVGRDVDALNEAGVIRAAVESVAENTVDAVVAPLFYGLIGGAPLALAYRAVNTLDSMIGCKNEHYLYFGWASARLDDLVNYVPARLCGVLIVMSAAIWGLDVRESWRILRRDSRKHASPNSGLPEAAVAGALQVQLGGQTSYQGSVSFQPHLGEPGKALTPGHIGQTMWLMVTSGILVILVALVIWGIWPF